MNVAELSVVIPVYNEKDNLRELIDRCLGACKKTGRRFEIILVDDGSADGSRDIISQAAKRHPEVIAVVLNRNYGQHAAVFAGLEQSKDEIVVTLDADLQNPPEEIPPSWYARWTAASMWWALCVKTGRTLSFAAAPPLWSTGWSSEPPG